MRALQNKYARRLNPELHNKTFKKGAASLLMGDTKVMSVKEGFGSTNS
jgi:hypothetical protein